MSEVSAGSSIAADRAPPAPAPVAAPGDPGDALGARRSRAPSGWRSTARSRSGARLIVANLMLLPPYPTTMMLAREYATLPHEEDLEAVRATAARAARARDRHRAAADLEPAPAGGADRADRTSGGRRCSCSGRTVRRTPRWQLRLRGPSGPRAQTDCLVWIAPDGWSEPFVDPRPVGPIGDLAASCRSGPCRTAAARRRGGRCTRPRRSTARDRPRGARRRPGRRGAPAPRRAAAARSCHTNVGSTGEALWAAKWAAKCC